MEFKFTVEEVNEKLKLLYGDQTTMCNETYKGVGHNATFIDNVYGEWVTKVSHVLSGGKHPIRAKINRGLKRRSNINDVKKRIQSVHGDHVKICDESYVKVNSHALFIDAKFGVFRATPNNVYAGNCHPICHHERQMRSTSNSTIIEHWKTGEQLCCTAGYEVAFVKWCNHNCINFDWQITHKMPNGKTYRVDAHILDGEFADLWIEIKGFFRGDISKQKWEWFHSEFTNSELWTSDRLISLGIMQFHPVAKYASQCMLPKSIKC